MLARRDHVLLVHVAAGEAVEQRKPGACPPEKSIAAGGLGASGMIDELGPAITVARDCVHRLELDRSAAAVQALDQCVPGDIEAQVLRLVDDARAVFEAHDQDRVAAVVRVGEIAFDSGDPAIGFTLEDVAADRRQIGIEAQRRIRAWCRSIAA